MKNFRNLSGNYDDEASSKMNPATGFERPQAESAANLPLPPEQPNIRVSVETHWGMIHKNQFKR